MAVCTASASKMYIHAVLIGFSFGASFHSIQYILRVTFCSKSFSSLFLLLLVSSQNSTFWQVFAWFSFFFVAFTQFVGNGRFLQDFSFSFFHRIVMFRFHAVDGDSVSTMATMKWKRLSISYLYVWCNFWSSIDSKQLWTNKNCKDYIKTISNSLLYIKIKWIEFSFTEYSILE